jgi:hypothetical protein
LPHKKATWGQGVPTTISIEEVRLRALKQADRDWLNPISMNELKEAVALKSTTVGLNGVLYEIKYRETDVFLRRCDGSFAPCGCVSYDSLKYFKFESS